MADDVLHKELPDSFEERVPPPLPTSRPTPHRWGLSVGTFVCLLVAVAALVFIVPKFSVVYVQVKIPVPFMTRILLGLSRVTCANLWIVGILMAFLPWSLGRLRGRWASLASVVVSIGGIATWAWMLVGLFLPLIGTLEGIGSIKH
jgi:hypothetical protein